MIAALAILEIPTGAIADLFGRVKTVFMALIFLTIGNLIMGFAHNSNDLILSVICMSIGAALYSGTFEAVVYDNLVDQNKESIYPTVIGRIKAISLIAYACCAPIGGFMYKFNPQLPFLAAALMALVGAILSLMITEPKRVSSQPSFLVYVNQLTSGMKQIINKQYVHLILPILVIGMFSEIAYEILDDVLFVNFGFSSVQLGIISGLAYVFYAVIGLLTPKISQIPNKRIVHLVFGLLIGISFAITPLLGMWLGGMVIIMRESISQLFDGYSSVEINGVIDSEHRATALSSFSMLKNGLYVLMAFWIGKAMNSVGPKNFAGWLGLAMICCLTLVMVKFQTPHRPCGPDCTG